MSPKPKVDRTEFARLNADGWTIPQLVGHFGCHRTSVSRIRAELGVTPDRRLMTPERRATIEGMLEDGWSFAEIGRTEGADPATLRKHFPGRQWTGKQRAEHLAALRAVNDWNGRHYQRVAA